MSDRTIEYITFSTLHRRLENQQNDLSSQQWFHLLQASHRYRCELENERSLFFQKRTRWEVALKFAIASITITGLSLGANPLLLLTLSATVLFLTTLFIHFRGAIVLKPFQYHPPKQIPSLTSSKNYQRAWFEAQHKFEVKKQRKKIQQRCLKATAASIVAIILIIATSGAFSIPLLLSECLFLTSLLVQAGRLDRSYCEPQAPSLTSSNLNL